MTARRLQQLGRDMLCGSPHHQGGIQDAQTPHLAYQTPPSPPNSSAGWISAWSVSALYQSAQP